MSEEARVQRPFRPRAANDFVRRAATRPHTSAATTTAPTGTRQVLDGGYFGTAGGEKRAASMGTLG
jgi:hypothetical protein